MKGNFDDYESKLKKIKLDPSRKNLKPDPPHWTFEEQLAHAVADGFKLLEAEEKAGPAKSVKSSAALEDALGKMSDNPYVKARAEILKKMKPEQRIVIEKMEQNKIERDRRYDEFCKAVSRLGDSFSR